MDMFYVGGTYIKTDAENCLKYAREIACDYSFCSLADIRDLLGLPSKYKYNKIKFTLNQLKGAIIKSSKDGGAYYEIYIPLEDACDLQKPFSIRDDNVESTSPRIDIFMNRGHWVATIDNKFFCTGDNFTEVTTELENYMNRKED